MTAKSRKLLQGSSVENVGFSNGTSGSAKTEALRKRLAEIETSLSSDSIGKITSRDEDGTLKGLQGKLLQVGESFVGFDKEIEEIARSRRQISQSRFDQLDNQMGELERSVGIEVKKRVDFGRTLQIITEKYANEMLERLQKRITSSMGTLVSALDTLSARCVTLERGLLQFRGKLPSKLGAQLTRISSRVEICRKAVASLGETASAQRGEESEDLLCSRSHLFRKNR